eukprot:1578130-Prymnesium_polylepis.1
MCATVRDGANSPRMRSSSTALAIWAAASALATLALTSALVRATSAAASSMAPREAWSAGRSATSSRNRSGYLQSRCTGRISSESIEGAHAVACSAQSRGVEVGGAVGAVGEEEGRDGREGVCDDLHLERRRGEDGALVRGRDPPGEHPTDLQQLIDVGENKPHLVRRQGAVCEQRRLVGVDERLKVADVRLFRLLKLAVRQAPPLALAAKRVGTCRTPQLCPLEQRGRRLLISHRCICRIRANAVVGLAPRFRALTQFVVYLHKRFGVAQVAVAPDCCESHEPGCQSHEPGAR